MLSLQEERLKKLLNIFSFLFAGAGLFFVLAPHLLISQINHLSQIITPQLPLLSENTENFWLSLTGSLMVTLTALSYAAQMDLRRRKDLVVYILISKITSTFFFLTFFIFTLRSLAYLVGAATDGSIFIILLLFYLRAGRSSQLLP